MTQVAEAQVASEDQVNETEAAQAAEAAFAAIDDDGAKPEPKVIPEQPAKSEAEIQADAKAAEEAAALAAAEAEWEGVPPKVRQTLESISGKIGTIDELSHIVKSQDGRVGAALAGVKALQTALDAAKTATSAGESAPSQERIAAAATSSAKWNQIKEDFPEWAEAVDERMAAQAAEFAKHPAGSVDVAGIKQEIETSFSQTLAKVKKASTHEARQLAQVDIKHPGWEETVRTPEYAAWVKTQAPDIQALGDSDRAADAIRLLDAYTEHSKAVAEATAKAAKNKSRLDSAVTPKGVAVASSRTISDREAAQQAFASVDNE